MPTSGSVPLNPFWRIWKWLIARITCKPLPGSAPSKLFEDVTKFVTVLMDRRPASGSVPWKPFSNVKNLLTPRITWRPLPGSAPLKPF
eukprot:4304190-Amphidinium_carterae.1